MNDIFLTVNGVRDKSEYIYHQEWTGVNFCFWCARGKDNSPNLMGKVATKILLCVSNEKIIRKIGLSIFKPESILIEYPRIILENVIIAEVLLHDSGVPNDIDYVLQSSEVIKH